MSRIQPHRSTSPWNPITPTRGRAQARPTKQKEVRMFGPVHPGRTQGTKPAAQIVQTYRKAVHRHKRRTVITTDSQHNQKQLQQLQHTAWTQAKLLEQQTEQNMITYIYRRQNEVQKPSRINKGNPVDFVLLKCYRNL